jgi:hypothetical protein
MTERWQVRVRRTSDKVWFSDVGKSAWRLSAKTAVGLATYASTFLPIPAPH